MLFSTNSFKQLGNKIPSTTCVGSQVRFDYKRTTLPIACSLQMFCHYFSSEIMDLYILYACNSRV